MNEEKQIEEMAKDLMECFEQSSFGGYDGEFMAIAYEDFAKLMLQKRYRKQSEDVPDINVGNKSEWILYKPRRENRNATYKCSACGKLCSSYYNDVGAWKYCPNCGAKMKGGAKE